MIRRCKAAVPVTRQIGELTDNAVAGTAHRYRDGCPRSVPGIGNRIILPGLALLAEGSPIEPTYNVNLAVSRIIDCCWEIPAISIWHWRACGSSVCRDIVDLRRSHDIEARVKSTKHINLVGVRGVSDSRIVEANSHIGQWRPAVRNRVIPVKSVSWKPGKPAR